MRLIDEWHSSCHLPRDERRILMRQILASNSERFDYPDRQHLGYVGNSPFTPAKVTITDLNSFEWSQRCTVLVGFNVDFKKAVEFKLKDAFYQSEDDLLLWRWDADPISSYQQLNPST